MEVYGDISTLIHKWLSIRIQFERNTYIGILILMKILIYIKKNCNIYVFMIENTAWDKYKNTAAKCTSKDYCVELSKPRFATKIWWKM